MSMLAEPRRKQRFTLNPRGKLWTEDANSFGQKILKKMGWTNGKGLGANEDGNTEALRVNYKNDSKGMGYKEIEQWTAHDENFSSLLEKLNGNREDSDDKIIKINSLETKGKNCRARINYHKFTKAKDLSKYSEKDLASILGKKTLIQKGAKEDINDRNEKVTEVNGDLKMENNNMLNQGSMVDYFKKKLPNFSKRISEYAIGNNGVLKRERSDSESERPGFGFSQNTNSDGNINGEENIKKKKRTYAETFFSYSDKDTENIEDVESVQKEISKKKKSKSDFVHGSIEDKMSKNYEESTVMKKKNKSKETAHNFVSYVSEGDSEITSVDKLNGEQDLESKEKKKKKKNKLKQMNKSSKCEGSLQDKETCTGEFYDVSKEKKLKESKCKDKGNASTQINRNSEENLNEDIVYDELNKIKSNVRLKELTLSTVDVKENSFDVKKKKVKKNQTESEIQNNQDNSEEVFCETITITSDKKPKKHKKKRNEDTILTSVDVNESTEVSNYSENNADTSVEPVRKKEKKACIKSYMKESNCEREGNTDCLNNKKLKKKKSKNSNLEDDTNVNSESLSQNENNKYVNEDIEGCSTEIDGLSKKSKKKKKSNEKEECGNSGILNPAFNDNNNSISPLNCSLQVGSNNEETNLSQDLPKKKKKKRTFHQAGIDNPLFNEDVDNLNTTSSEQSLNPYEIKVKKKKKSDVDVGVDNPALNLNDSIPDTDLILNIVSTHTVLKKIEEKSDSKSALNLSDSIPDTDLMLNIVSTPTILKKTEGRFDSKASIERMKRQRRKSVRFSDVLQERIIPFDPAERTNEYISNRNELFDINTTVVEDGIREEMAKQGLTYQSNTTSFELNSDSPKEISKRVVESSVLEELNRSQNACGFINNGFDIKSVDKVNFYETKYEVKSPNSKGIDNRAFNKLKNHIEENVESVSNTIERYQAEVENNINEAKVSVNLEQVNTHLVGDVGSQIDRNMKVPEGTKLCFKEMYFRGSVPLYLTNTVNFSKKSYRHLIRGDITVAFKNSNLHELEGYAVGKKVKLGMSS